MLQAINRSSSDKSLYLVCFDIVSDKIRYRVVKCLKTYGQRVQKSVFECMLNDKQYDLIPKIYAIGRVTH